jgi:hypothetical protein
MTSALATYVAATATPGKTHPVVIGLCVGVVVVLILFIIFKAAQARRR